MKDALVKLIDFDHKNDSPSGLMSDAQKRHLFPFGKSLMLTLVKRVIIAF